MSDIDNLAPQDWRELCKAALVELDPVKLPERIALAQTAILDRINSQSQSYSELQSLQDALSTLETLRSITERQNGSQSRLAG